MPETVTRRRLATRTRAARIWSSKSTVKEDWTFHQLAPYIGRMKTSMARSLVLHWTRPGDLIVDPFCGCGVVALEAAAHGRRVVAGDCDRTRPQPASSWFRSRPTCLLHP